MQLRLLLLLTLAFFPLPAQPPAAPKVTQIMATLSVKPGVAREQIMKVMPDEVRDTVCASTSMARSSSGTLAAMGRA